MSIRNLLSCIILALLFMSCGNGTDGQKPLYSITINNLQKAYTPNDKVSVTLSNRKNEAIDSVVYFLDKQRITLGSTTTTEVSLQGLKLGRRALTAAVYVDGKKDLATETITLLAAERPKLYTYQVLESYPHDRNAFTQGLEFYNDTLFESTGQYENSSLRKTDYTTGEVIAQVDLAEKYSKKYFAEGLTFLNDKLYQLTWRENIGLIYNPNTLEQTGTFVYGESKQGWGLCNDGTRIYKSDGSERIWTLSAETLAEEDYIEVYTNTSRIKDLNELEWVEGKIYANLWDDKEKSKGIAIINPASGAVEGVINLRGLVNEVTDHKDLNILNGIAYNGEANILYVTGKNWDKLFKIEIIEK